MTSGSVRVPHQAYIVPPHDAAIRPERTEPQPLSGLRTYCEAKHRLGMMILRAPALL